MTIDIDSVMAALTLDQKVSLLAGHDNWHTKAVPGVPAMRMSDGPAGVRGTSWTGPASASFPCGTALGATFDPELVEQVGAALGEEARSKGAHVLLAPTVNLHRTPIGGRNFECMSEDPFLTSRIAVGYIRGVQQHHVARSGPHQKEIGPGALRTRRAASCRWRCRCPIRDELVQPRQRCVRQ